MKTRLHVILVLVIFAGVVAHAQPSPNVTVFATGFNEPRGLKWGPDGNLYVAEAGTPSGTLSTVGICEQVPAPVGPWVGGFSARISKVAPDGTRTTLTRNLPSAHAQVPGVLGVADVAFIGNQLYASLTGGGCSHGHPHAPNAILKVNADGSWKRIANLSEFLHLHPVKNPEPADFEPDGSWYGMIAFGGNLYAIEPNHGEVDIITQQGIVSRLVDVSETQGHVVPTVLVRKGNAFYVSNLNTFPITPGSSHLYTVTNVGGIPSVRLHLTTVLGIVVKDNDFYFLEMSTAAGNPTPGTGDVKRLHAGTLQTVATGLTFPTGMTVGPDGALYVSNFGFGFPPGAGQILRIAIP